MNDCPICEELKAKSLEELKAKYFQVADALKATTHTTNEVMENYTLSKLITEELSLRGEDVASLQKQAFGGLYINIS